jgi:hypothetical protein
VAAEQQTLPALPPPPFAAALDAIHLQQLAGCREVAAIQHLRSFSTTHIANTGAAINRAICDIASYKACAPGVAAARLQQLGAARLGEGAVEARELVGAVRDRESGVEVPRALVLWEWRRGLWEPVLALLRGGQRSARELTAFHLVHLGRLDGRGAVRVLGQYAQRARAAGNPSGMLLKLELQLMRPAGRAWVHFVACLPSAHSGRLFSVIVKSAHVAFTLASSQARCRAAGLRIFSHLSRPASHAGALIAAVARVGPVMGATTRPARATGREARWRWTPSSCRRSCSRS